MRSQAERDQKTLVISTALVLFVLVLFAGGAILWAINAVVGVSDEATSGLLIVLMLLSGVLSVVYVLRAPKH
jgi:predicted Na+-dependent transporter